MGDDLDPLLKRLRLVNTRCESRDLIRRAETEHGRTKSGSTCS